MLEGAIARLVPRPPVRLLLEKAREGEEPPYPRDAHNFNLKATMPVEGKEPGSADDGDRRGRPDAPRRALSGEATRAERLQSRRREKTKAPREAPEGAKLLSAGPKGVFALLSIA